MCTCDTAVHVQCQHKSVYETEEHGVVMDMLNNCIGRHVTSATRLKAPLRWAADDKPRLEVEPAVLLLFSQVWPAQDQSQCISTFFATSNHQARFSKTRHSMPGSQASMCCC